MLKPANVAEFIFALFVLIKFVAVILPFFKLISVLKPTLVSDGVLQVKNFDGFGFELL